MDREKERLEQEAFDAHNRRRLKRNLLRSYIQAYIVYHTNPDPVEYSLAKLVLISSRHTLQRMGFTRFAVLRAYAQKYTRMRQR